jgi:hypothetical protein
MISHDSSVEASSQMISSKSLKLCPRALSMAARRNRAWLYDVRIVETLGS